MPVLRDLKSLEASVLMARGLDSLLTGEQKSAAQNCEAAARLVPPCPWLQYMRADLALKTGRREEGLSLLREVAVTSNAPEIVNKSQQWLGRGYVNKARAAKGMKKIEW